MKTVFFLKTCDTCRNIMKPLDLSGWELREIKSKPFTGPELDELHRLAGSYKALFSNRSTQIRKREINPATLTEDDVKKLLLEHYSFLKRPVFVDGDHIFIGNDKHNVELLNAYFAK